MCIKRENRSARTLVRIMVAIGILFSLVGLIGTVNPQTQNDHISLALISQLKFLLPCGVIILAWVNIKLTAH